MQQLNNVEPIGEDRKLDAGILLVIVEHFVLSKRSADGHGLFEGDEEAVLLAREMGEMPVMKFKKYRVVPAKFHEWLRKMILPPGFALPVGKSTIQHLRASLEDSNAGERLVDYFFERGQGRRRNEHPELRRSFGTQQGTWTAIENMRLMRHVRRPR